MSIKHSLLALLGERPRYGYELRAEFEARTGATWPLNIGQVYTTLDRLERDGLVTRGAEEVEGHVTFSITTAGRAAVSDWFAMPTDANGPPRSELAIKLALAVTIAGVDVAAVIQTQRTASMRVLQDFTRQRRTETEDTAWLLVLDSLIFATEAELHWLDHCENWMRRRAAVAPVAAGATEPAVRA